MMRICGSGSQTPINFKTFGSHHPDFEKKSLAAAASIWHYDRIPSYTFWMGVFKTWVDFIILLTCFSR